MKRLLLSSISFIVCTIAMAQKSYWSSHTGTAKIQTTKEVARQSFPTNFQLFDLDISPLKSDLLSVAGNTSGHKVIITLPNAKGELEKFEMVEASNFDKKLQKMFPEIRAFSGRSLSDKAATVKLSISPQGIQTMVFRTATENEFIEAYSQDRKTYAVFKSQRQPGKLPWACSTEDVKLTENIGNQIGGSGVTARSGANLKTLRLAQSVTAEYSNYFGATSSAQVGLVLAAINNTLTRCNGVYEKDLALHLNLIANTTSVIYYNASTDPYSAASTGAGGAWNNELQNTLTAVIGEANYDIGHLFGATGGGGNAGCIGCVCTNGSKGKGFTSPKDGIPTGDNFDIDYVVHEVGHQLGANHTFSHNNEGTGVNKEVGSGITIMGYAGITTQDVAPHSIDIYHQASIAQIQANINTKTCPVTSTIVNATPVVNTVSNYTIPISTPFALTGSATDADAGDVLTYCWEQNDNASTAQTGNSSRASTTKASGPNWITYSPTTSPVRYFPNLNTILAGGTTTGPITGGDAGVLIEALSSVSRTLNFRLTVRDNAPYSSTAPISVGQTQFTDVVVTVSNTSGPFTVSAPNTAVSWAGGSSQNITWNVANTTVAPVSCANVKISLSTDGGQTFPTVLVASTPNDGSQAVTIPNTPTTTARIKIEAVGNIFFDISNANFTITAGSSCGTPSGLASSAITTSGATVSWSAVSGADSYAVDYKAASSSTWISLSTAQTTTTADITGLAEGTLYDWRVTATCASGTSAPASAQFTTASTVTCNAPTGLASSAITASSATVSWTAVSGAVSYAVDYKLNSSSTWTSFSTAQTTTSANLTGLSASSLYDWRVKTNCAAGSSATTSAQFTTTAAATTCPGIYDVSTNGTTGGAATIPFNTDIKGLISPRGDNDYYKFVITNAGTITLTLTTLPADYDLRLRNSAGTQVAISQNGSTTGETINYTAAAGTYYAQVYGYNNANNASVCYTLKVATGTASKGDVIAKTSINKPLLSVFPNPAASRVNVSLAGYKGTSDIKLFDINGKQVASYRTAEINSSLDISKLTKGVYMLRIVTTDGTILTHKVIKQ